MTIMSMDLIMVVQVQLCLDIFVFASTRFKHVLLSALTETWMFSEDGPKFSWILSDIDQVLNILVDKQFNLVHGVSVVLDGIMILSIWATSKVDIFIQENNILVYISPLL